MTEFTPPADTPSGFDMLGLSAPVLRILAEVGYESPSPIQAASIPHLMAGRDLVGTAQTGTGKTAAFALPILSRLDLTPGKPQALVLAPTRELAIQVAEAFQKYASHLRGFHVLPIYGGQSYVPQLQALKRGVHVVVGTPGRVIDHLNRGTLDLSALKTLVLDEADEMLRMGFIDDVEAVLRKLPAERQVVLFSATMPAPIRRIAATHLHDPAEVTIKGKTTTAINTRQRYWLVSGLHKLDALTRILEVESFDGMIVFARTKISTDELASKLEARGFAAAAINGDMPQPLREKTIQRLKDGLIDILVATDVAARGLDVDRISHVVNFDIPYDTEAYVHRIGRTGRAGRSGEAILFVSPRERGMLRAIERATRQAIEPMSLPSIEDVNSHRIGKFKQQITAALASADLSAFRTLVEDYEREHDVPAVEIAAALARMAQGDNPLLLDPARQPKLSERPAPAPHESRKPTGHDAGSIKQRHADWREQTASQRQPHSAPLRPLGDARPVKGSVSGTPPNRVLRESLSERGDPAAPPPRRERSERPERSRPHTPEPGMERFRIEVGHNHQVKPGNIVGAIANEAELDSEFIGRIEIYDDFSLVDLPEGMPEPLLRHLQGVWVAGQRLRIRRADDTAVAASDSSAAAAGSEPQRPDGGTRRFQRPRPS